MTGDAARAVDRLEVAAANHTRAQRQLAKAERARARAVLECRAAGLTTYEIASLLGVNQPRVLALSKWGVAQGLAPEGWEPPGSGVRPGRSAAGGWG